MVTSTKLIVFECYISDVNPQSINVTSYKESMFYLVTLLFT